MARSFLLVATAAWLPAAEASALRGPDSVLAGLEHALVHSWKMTDVVEETLGHLNEALMPVYKALPRSQDGRLDVSAVHYLLHRYFIDRYGWFVPGSGRQEAWNETLPNLLIGNARLANSLSQRLKKRGLSLNEVAILAAAVEMLAGEETKERLHAAYRLAGLSHRNEHASEHEVARIIEVYLPLYVIGMDYDSVTELEMNQTLAEIYSPIPRWDELLKWTHEVSAEVLGAPELGASFNGLLPVFETINARYAHRADKECLSVKQNLSKYATPGTGRVPLATFYKASLPGGWRPDEPVEELRAMGALDETDRRQPSVVVPNYFDTPANCEDPSRYYSVCCISECEALMKHLEHELGSPKAPPQQIVAVVERLPSAAVEAPRKLPEQLVQRLDGIATIYGGQAKLHGRLFRQWMHHAYPTECPFPFVESAARASDSAVVELAQPNAEELTAQPNAEDAAVAEVTQSNTEEVAQPNAEEVAQPNAEEVAPMQLVEARGEAPEVVALEIPWLDEEVVFIRCEGPPSEGLVAALHGDTWQGVIIVVVAVCMAFRLSQMLVPAARAMGWLPAAETGPAAVRKLPM